MCVIGISEAQHLQEQDKRMNWRNNSQECHKINDKHLNSNPSRAENTQTDIHTYTLHILNYQNKIHVIGKQNKRG